MYNPSTGYVTETKEIMWLHCMCYRKQEARHKFIVYPQVASPFKLEDKEAKEGLMLNASEPKIKSADDE